MNIPLVKTTISQEAVGIAARASSVKRSLIMKEKIVSKSERKAENVAALKSGEYLQVMPTTLPIYNCFTEVIENLSR